MSQVHPKIAGGGLCGALVGIVISIAEAHGVKVDAGLAVDCTTALAFLVGWLVPSVDMSTPVQK